MIKGLDSSRLAIKKEITLCNDSMNTTANQSTKNISTNTKASAASG